MKKIYLSLLIAIMGLSAAFGQQRTVIRPLDGEYWWGAVLNKGANQPFTDFGGSSSPQTPFDLCSKGAGGATMPLLVSNKGRYVWSDRPFSFEVADGVLIIYSNTEKVEPVQAGETLKDAYMAACHDHFPFDGREPAEIMFTKPQFNNWIESAVLGINQKNAEDYVDGVAASGFPCGVLEIDGGWQVYHGKRDFHPDSFPEPARLFDKIHSYGYNSMIWVSIFLSPDSRPEYVNYKPTAQNLLVRSKSNPKEAALVYWWNGISVCMDLTSDKIREKFTNELKAFADRFNIDGFKFDGGDPDHFRKNAIFSEPWMVECDFTHAFNQVAESFPIHEFRAGFKTGGMPLVIRLNDIGHSWPQLRTVLPDMLVAGLIGSPYVLGDMIGGGLSSTFLPGSTFSHKLFVRSCELQALTPMMQFSAAPWRVLTPEECEICRNFAQLHCTFADYIMEQVHHASETGEPIMRSMEYQYPGRGYEMVNQQFMLGDKYLVAPVVDEDDSKTIYLPDGKWKDDLGKVHRGPKVLALENVPLDRLPYFELVK